MNRKWIIPACLVILLMACSTAPETKLSSLEKLGQQITTTRQVRPKTFAGNEEFVVLISRPGETLASLAEQFLGDEKLAWVIADFNGIEKLVPKREIVIPLKPQNLTGVTPHGYQQVPVLCYHRFGPGRGKMIVSERKFRAQMQYLADNDFHVVTLSELYDFINGRKGLPQKSVVITIDDGYRSNYDIAFPVLREFGFPATIFLYTDFMGARDAMSWSQIREMADSGLIDFQPHSRSHPNMTLPRYQETTAAYRQRIRQEISAPTQKIRRALPGQVLHTFAYPYGDTNDQIIDYLQQKNYRLGVTVQPGGNPSFAYPYMLHRTMIFGDHGMRDFVKALSTFKQVDLQ